MTARPASRIVPPRRRGRGVIPVFLLVWGMLLLFPLVVLFAYSFFQSRNFAMVYTPSLATWRELFASGRFEVTLRTLRIALSVTAIELVLGFPFALWLVKGQVGKGTRAVILALLTIPLFLDLSSRIIVWRGILGEHGFINTALEHLGLISEPLRGMLYTEGAVQFGMVLSNFPSMVLPIYMSLAILDGTLLAAAADLGASPARVMRDIILPLALPGIMAGVVLTLGSALAAWVEPAILGGGFVDMLSASVDSAYTALRYPVVAALSSFAMLLIAGLLAVFVIATRRMADIGGTFRSLEG